MMPPPAEPGAQGNVPYPPGGNPALRDRPAALRVVAFNTAVQLAARVAASLVGVVQVGVLAHYLHSHSYGEFGFVLSVIGICGLITDMGVGTVAVRSLSQAEPAARGSILGQVLVARLLLAGLALVASDVFALAVPLDASERAGILVMSLAYITSVPGAVVVMFQVELELQYAMALGVAQTYVTFGAIVLLVYLHASFATLLALFPVVGAIGAAVTYLVVVRRYRPSVSFDLSAGLSMVKEALPVGIAASLVVLYFRIDSIMLGLIRGPVDVAHYLAAYKYVDVANFGAGALMASVYPLMLRAQGKDGGASLTRVYQLATDVMMAVSIPVAVAWSILARPIVFLVYPADFAAAIGALQILSWVLIPLFYNNAAGAVVLTLHRERTLMWVTVGALVINVGLNAALIPAFGINAAAAITVVTELYVSIVGTYVISRTVRFVPSLRIALLALFASVLMAGPVYLLRGEWPLAVAVGALVYAASTYLCRLWSWSMVRSVTRRAT